MEKILRAIYLNN